MFIHHLRNTGGGELDIFFNNDVKSCFPHLVICGGNKGRGQYNTTRYSVQNIVRVQQQAFPD